MYLVRAISFKTVLAQLRWRTGVMLGVIIGVLSMTTGCQQHVHSYTQTTLKQLTATQGVPLTDALANQVTNQFVSTFEALGTASFTSKADALFADSFYINDTLAQHRSKSSLMTYFVPMNKRVTNSKVVILNQYHTADTLYLHWTMGFDFSLFGKVTPMYSSGITQLKLNPAGQIIYQQDYWDPNNGLYRNLPMIGWLYRWLLPMH